MTLHLEGVTYRYPGTAEPALSDVTLTLERGEVLGVTGANEAGKTTLALVASGLAPAVTGGRLTGSVRVDELDAARARPWQLAARCAVLFQNATTQLSGTAQTVYEEIAFGPRNLGLDLGGIVERVEESLAMLGIERLAARDPASLSGGEAQLVALASVLAMRARYLVLDEPTSELDPRGTSLVATAVEKVASRGDTGLLLLEQKTDLLESIARRVVVLAAGRVAREGLPAEVLADPLLLDLGVEPPASVRLRRAVQLAGLDAEILA